MLLAGVERLLTPWTRAVRLVNALRARRSSTSTTRSTGPAPDGILDLLGEHLAISVVAVLRRAGLALPVGIALGTTGRGGGAIVVLSNVSRAVPTLALLTLFAVSPIGFGTEATTIALAVFAFPPILTNTYVGFRGVDADVREAARAMGMRRRQVIRRVELPAGAAAGHDRRPDGGRAGGRHRRRWPRWSAAAGSAGSSTSASASRTTALIIAGALLDRRRWRC